MYLEPYNFITQQLLRKSCEIAFHSFLLFLSKYIWSFNKKKKIKVAYILFIYVKSYIVLNWITSYIKQPNKNNRSFVNKNFLFYFHRSSKEYVIHVYVYLLLHWQVMLRANCFGGTQRNAFYAYCWRNAFLTFYLPMPIEYCLNFCIDDKIIYFICS